MNFPWHAKQWQQLWQAKKENRFPHALLFSGIAGTGKMQFVDELTHALLCQSLKNNNEPCHKCHSCRLVSGKTHPNLYWIQPEKEGQAIKIDQIREASDFIHQTSIQGAHRILIINPADSMNMHAANSLLKSLEEPPNGVLFILLSNHASQLPATILSRCQRVIFPCPLHEEALNWLNKKLTALQKKNLEEMGVDAALLLRLADGAPLAAVQLIKEGTLALRCDLYRMLSLSSHPETYKRSADYQVAPIKTADAILDLTPKRFIDLMICWMMDLVRLQLGDKEENIINQDFSQHIKAAFQIGIKDSMQFLTHLQQLNKQVCSGINLNKQLMIEHVLIHWLQLTRRNYVSG